MYPTSKKVKMIFSHIFKDLSLESILVFILIRYKKKFD